MDLKRTARLWRGTPTPPSMPRFSRSPATGAPPTQFRLGDRRRRNELWSARFAGIGAGLASFLSAALPDRVIPVTFSTKTKSDLGWYFVGAVETGRYRDYSDDGEPDTRQYWHEVKACMAASASPPPARD